MFSETNVILSVIEEILLYIVKNINAYPTIGALLLLIVLIFIPAIITKLLNLILKKCFKSTYFFVSSVVSYSIIASVCSLLPVLSEEAKWGLCAYMGFWQLEILWIYIEDCRPYLYRQIVGIISFEYIKSSKWRYFLGFLLYVFVFPGMLIGIEIVSHFKNILVQSVVILGIITCSYLTPIMIAYLIKSRFNWAAFKKALTPQNH